MKVINCEQNTPEWFEARKGIATASQFSKIMTPKTGKLSASAKEYIFDLIAENHIGIPDVGVVGFESDAMANGKRMEGEARNWFAFENDVECEEVGFVKTDCGNFGCSPDSLIPEWKSGLEIKCPMLKTHIKYLYNGTLPDEYKLQVHGSMVVTGLDKWMFLSYTPEDGFENLIIEVVRDEFTEKVKAVFSEYLELKCKIIKELGL